MKSKMKTKQENGGVALTFSKEKILKSRRFGERADFLSVLLQDGKRYTFCEVDEILHQFLKG